MRDRGSLAGAEKQNLCESTRKERRRGERECFMRDPDTDDDFDFGEGRLYLFSRNLLLYSD